MNPIPSPDDAAAARRVVPGRGRPARRPHPRPRRPHPCRWPSPVIAALAVTVSALLLVAGTPDAAFAAESIDAVVNNIRTWLVGILVAVATLFLTVGGLRYLAANGDPGEVEKAKLALKSAAIGYALAMLAPLFVTIVGQWVK
ncbi:pilin [Krasilnikovia sp. MM14-A1259]|uniref:pilin n=1 Tax=Krasilnikovia sp. MM14-A1259 TaxID=3373539 RepID=UPI003826E614